MALNITNAHTRDSRITFDEEPHIYYVDGSCEGYISGTTIIHSMFTPFDKEKVSQLTHKKHFENKGSEYYQMTQTDIIQKWNTNTAAVDGTKMHKDIELFLLGDDQGNESIEFTYFLDFMKDHTFLRPYRTEWMIFDDIHKIAGSIDVVFERDDGKIVLGDWKRVKNIRYGNNFQSGLHGLKHVQDCNFNHYTLQLNLYRYIIETFYNKEVVEMFLVVLHPNNKGYMKLQVPIVHDDICTMLDSRKVV